MANAHSSHHAKADAGHGGLKSYLTGFMLAVVLTVIAFAVVMTSALGREGMLVVVALAAVAQILVHLYFFLHMNSSPEQRSTVLTFAFTVLIVAIVIAGSLWIMYNLNANMMMSH
ncbi:cytochrome o ubiquinol oxidase subunit IV [Ramlibacter sp. H39-3-26]|uniref:cytochrome o ubiquinol oxidase subunit IV n=1 Tax=Curvibacter soli TaxID=3031331 RepID=UPI0023DCD60A|nr:cytochrome o ubiquinol oxidase subunit IV [Ramlibacter sp. H39-3-26]MDF1486533.1 cytochrome o ubiquinol oxidase subunit IV [Ramlibacter sp. H39-3-26]